MTDHQTPFYTFHRIREQCEQGNPAAWRAFLEAYAPFCLRLLDQYPPPDGTPPAQTFAALLRSLAEGNYEPFRATPRTSEREFLSVIRARLLDLAAGGAGLPAAVATETASSAPALDAAGVGRLLEGLPLVHQEILFFKLAGYSDKTIERILRVAPRVAAKSLERLAPDHAAALRLERDRCPWPGPWLALLRQARSAATDACPPLYQAIRIQDGQVSWYDKEPAEKHVGECLHCLERWTALREVAYWRRACPPLSGKQAEEFMRALPVAAEPKKPLLKRLWS